MSEMSLVGITEKGLMAILGCDVLSTSDLDLAEQWARANVRLQGADGFVTATLHTDDGRSYTARGEDRWNAINNLIELVREGES